LWATNIQSITALGSLATLMIPVNLIYVPYISGHRAPQVNYSPLGSLKNSTQTVSYCLKVGNTRTGWHFHMFTGAKWNSNV